MSKNELWPKWERYLCVCFCMYTILYIIPFPFTYIGVFSEVGDFINSYTWFKFIPWVGKVILGINEEIPFTMNSSGDRLYYWIKSLVLIAIAILTATVVLFINPKKLFFQKLLSWTNVYIVYFLIGSMVLYGMAKVIKLQFSDPSLLTLLKEYGHFSPASMAWAFMGHSDIYAFFAGISEVSGAILLLFRRTRVLGALTVFGVSLNVFMFDVSFDISVKLYALHLTLYALYLGLKDGRVLRILVLNKPTKPLSYKDHFGSQRLNKFLFYSKIIVVGAFIAWQLQRSLTRYANRYDPNNLSDLYGIYDISFFKVNSDTLPPLLTDRTRWRKLVIQNKSYGVVKPMYDNSNQYFDMELDTLNKMMMLKSRKDSTDVYNFNYSQEGDSLLFLTGFHNIDSLQIHLKAYDLSKFDILRTEVDWISDRTKF